MFGFTPPKLAENEPLTYETWRAWRYENRSRPYLSALFIKKTEVIRKESGKWNTV